MKCNQYSRTDGVVGFGFVIQHANKAQHSVAWPDDTIDRYLDDELAERRIAVSECGQPCQCYHRADGVIGVGCAVGERHAIAWPDRVGDRLHVTRLQEEGITIGSACDGCDGACEVGDVNWTVENGEVTSVNASTDEGEPGLENFLDEFLGELRKPTDEEVTEPVVEPVAEVEPPKPEFVFDGTLTEATNIANYLAVFPTATNAEVINALHGHGLEVSTSQVSRQRKKLEPVQTDTSETTV